MMVRDPFTGYASLASGLPQANSERGSQQFGNAPYVAMPQGRAPAVRADALPPVVAPTRGPYGYRKANVPVEVTPGWWARVGALTFGPGGSSRGQGGGIT